MHILLQNLASIQPRKRALSSLPALRVQIPQVDLPEFIALLEVVADQFGLLDEDGAVAFEDHFRKADTDRSTSVNLHEFAVFLAELLDAMPHTHEQRAAELGRACKRVEKKMTGQ